jgi:hypothetical protein
MVIPPFIESITADAFTGCDWLTDLSFAHTGRLRVVRGFAHCAICHLCIPVSVEIIDEEAFAGCMALRKLQFAPLAHIRALHGFEECGLKRVMIPGNVEVIGPRAFRNCRFLNIVVFSENSKLETIDGFAGTSVESVVIPASVSTIGATAFEGCARLSRVEFLMGSVIDDINGFRKTSATLVFPDSMLHLPSFHGSRHFLVWGIPILKKMRWHQSHPPMPKMVRYPSEVVASPYAESFRQLPILPPPYDHLATSLSIAVRIRTASEIPFSSHKPSHATQFIPQGTDRITLDSVISMFAATPSFRCTPLRQRKRADSFVFHVICDQCGPDSSVRIECSRDALTVQVQTYRCCGHFFIGMILPEDGRKQTFFVTNPRIEAIHIYSFSHPLRFMARNLLRWGHLAASHALLLQKWVDPRSKSLRGLFGEPSSDLPLVINELHGHIVLEVTVDKLVSIFLYAQQGIVTLCWVASWAIACLQTCQYYELDCSFQVLYPYVYCIPMAVSANVGIPLGIVVAPTERQEVFDLFARRLIEGGLPLDQFNKLPLLSDDGTALRAYGARHGKHFLCYRHLLESLGSRTLAAVLARRLLFTKTRATFDAIVGQTLSDFGLGCREGLITEKGKRKFCRIFGVSFTDDAAATDPIISVECFESQALWGERGRLGVACCTNHIEGLHGRLNQKAKPYRNVTRKFKKITDVITASADKWAQKVTMGRREAIRRLKRMLETRSLGEVESPCGVLCDQGAILSARLGMEIPCIHTASQTAIGMPDIIQFALPEVGPHVQIRNFQENWPFGLTKCKSRFPAEDNSEEVDQSVNSQDVRFINRVYRDLQQLHPGKELELSRDDVA